MNAPIIWIIFPILLSIVLLFLRKNQTVVIFIGVIISFWLAWVAWSISFDQIFQLGTRSFKIAETLSVFGRDFVLSNSERPIISLFYFINAFWMLGSFYARPSRLFVPYSIIVIALLTAVIAVEPFLYAALILEIIVLLSVPLLAEPGQASTKGVLRFLAFQTIAMPFILFTSWMVTGVETGPGDLELLSRATALLGIGLAFSLAVFPFHSWIPMTAEESQPYPAAYIFFIFPMGVSIFGLGLLDRFVWLRESEILLLILQSLGGIMVLIGGIWAAFENHLGRVLGFAAVMEIGYSLLAISIGGEIGILLYFWLLVPRIVSYVVWAMSLARLNLETKQRLDFDHIKGMGNKYPFLGVGIVLAIFSLAGIPFFAGFPVRLILWQTLAQRSSLIVGGTILGSIALMVAGLRSLSILFASPTTDNKRKLESMQTSIIDEGVEKDFETTNEDFIQGVEYQIPPQEKRARKIISWSMFFSFIILILYVGNFPQHYLPTIRAFLNIFEHLGK